MPSAPLYLHVLGLDPSRAEWVGSNDLLTLNYDIINIDPETAPTLGILQAHSQLGCHSEVPTSLGIRMDIP